MSDDEMVVSDLSAEECWDLLRRQEFGRLAYHDGDLVTLVPINYALDDEHRVIFRTAEGSKLLGLTMNADVAFEIDDNHVLWAQVFVADARRLDDDESRLRVARADVTARPRHEILLGQFQVKPL